MSALPIVAALLASAGSTDAVAHVDGAAITVGALARGIDAAGPGARAEQVLQTLIDEALLSAEGRRLALERSPVAVERLELLQRFEAASVFLRKELGARVAPDDETVRRLFHSTADFVGFDLLTYETAERAAAAIERIRKGATFAAEAPAAMTSRVQTDPKKAQLAMRGELPSSLATALFAAQPGALVGPVQLSEGFAVARILTKAVGTDAELEKRRASLTAFEKKQAIEQMRGHVVAQLRKRANVTLDEAFLRSIDEAEPTPQALDHVIATVGTRPLRYRDVFDTIRALRATGGHMGASIRISVAWREIDARLLQDVAVERGFLNDPEVVALRPEHQAAATGYAAMRRIMDAASPPTEDEIVKFYERNSAGFQRPFAQVLPQATAGAVREKRAAAYAEAVTKLRRKATISVDRAALARAAQPGA